MNGLKQFNSRADAASLWARLALAVALAATGFVPARADVPIVATLGPASRVWLEGNSTVHHFESTATKLVVHVTSAQPTAARGLEGFVQLVRAGQVQAVDVSIPVAEMQSGKTGLDKNMRKALKAEQFPRITFHLDRYTVAKAAASDSFVIDAHGMLSVAGVEKAIDIRAGALRSGESLRIRGTKELLMTQFGVKPPTMMMGAVKTSDQIVIHFDLWLVPSLSPPLVGMKGN